MTSNLTRRLFLKRASQACGILVFLPAAKSIGKIGLSNKEGYYEHSIVAMGTTARLGVYAKSEAAANEVITSAFNELKRLESLFTIFDERSEISQLNAIAGVGHTKISSDTLSILRSAIEYTRLTNGAFDITVEPLMRLWGFRKDSNELQALPTSEEIASGLQFVGSEQIELDAIHSTARLRSSGAKLDLGGIAVGYSLDKMVNILKPEGIENAFLDISGDIYALGAPHGHPGWNVAIPDPQDTSKLIYKTHISNEALATSGNYMSYVVYNAMRYGHIMDPHEGRSAHSVLSSTVIAKTGIDVDALSTASFVKGEKYGDTKLMLVNRHGSIDVS